ncbi:MAG: hypothetical protein NTU94_12845 [Planctomycetota bacterium]|nr:hypothetical protein [Planctomycetota bacterium]
MAQILADMEVMDGWTRRHMEEYQGERLRDLVLWAAQKAPYYRETFRRVGIRPDDIRGIQDLPRLPTLDKNVVRGDPRRFLAERRWPALLIRGHTSGSTGVPLVVYGDITSACWEEALLTRWRRRAGVQPRHRRVWVRGDQIVPPGQTARKP